MWIRQGSTSRRKTIYMYICIPIIPMIKKPLTATLSLFFQWKPPSFTRGINSKILNFSTRQPYSEKKKGWGESRERERQVVEIQSIEQLQKQNLNTTKQDTDLTQASSQTSVSISIKGKCRGTISAATMEGTQNKPVWEQGVNTQFAPFIRRTAISKIINNMSTFTLANYFMAWSM